MKGKALLLLIILSGFLFADAIKLHDESIISGDVIRFESGSFTADGQKVDREQVKKVMYTDTDKANTAVDPQYRLTDDKISEYRDIVGNMEKMWPDANGYVLYSYDRQQLTTDGREVSESRYAVYIKTQDAKNWANMSFYIDEGINRIHILYARSIAPDGKVTGYSPEDVTYSEPSRGAVFFGKGEVMSLTIPGVDVGSIVDIGYIQETYAPEDPELFIAQNGFQFGEPMYETVFDVEVPKDREIYYTSQYMDDYFKENWVTNIPGKEFPDNELQPTTRPEIIETDTSRIYRWSKKEIEPLIAEPSMPSYLNIVPLVFAGLYPDYEYYNKRFGTLHSEHMKITPTLDSLARAIVGDAESDSAKVARLYHWVQRNIRYISVKGALASRFGGHYAQITYDNKYGDCSDKAVFFATLCKVVGVEAYPIILMTNDAGFVHRDRFPYWGGNHAINEVWIDGKKHILDATNNNFRFPYYSSGDCDIWYCNYVRGETVYNPPIPTSYNAMRSQTSVKLDSDGSAFVTDSMYFTGDFEAGYRGWFEHTPEKQHKQIMENFASGRNPGSVLDKFAIYNVSEIEKPFTFRFSYDVPEFLIKAGNYLLMEVPALRYTFPEIALPERNYDVKLSYPFQRKHDVTFDIPDNYEIAFVPEKFSISNDYIDYTARYEKKGNQIRFVDEYNIKKIRIPKEDYKTYKKDAESIMAFVKEKVFLREKG